MINRTCKWTLAHDRKHRITITLGTVRHGFRDSARSAVPSTQRSDNLLRKFWRVAARIGGVNTIDNELGMVLETMKTLERLVQEEVIGPENPSLTHELTQKWASRRIVLETFVNPTAVDLDGRHIHLVEKCAMLCETMVGTACCPFQRYSGPYTGADN